MQVSLSEWLLFTLVLVSAMLIPGPGVVATIAYSLTLGAKRAMFFVLGAALGDLTFLWIALLGLSVFIQQASILLAIILLFAVIYFANMSYKLFVAFLQTNNRSNLETDVAISKNPVTGFFSGFSLTITNPKVVIFYLFILPVFLKVENFGTYDFLIVSLITPGCLLVVLGTYAFATGLAKKLLSTPSFTSAINLIASMIFGFISILLVVRLLDLLISTYWA